LDYSPCFDKTVHAEGAAMINCERCGKPIKASAEIARWLRTLLRETEELAIVRMIDGDLAAGRITSQDADAQRASVMLPYIRIHLQQLIDGIEVCPHEGPASSDSGIRRVKTQS
jgi:hypothetical protein